MITDTKDGQTNYCPMCEDQARRIEELKADVKVARGQYQGACDIIKELERRERMLVDALNAIADENSNHQIFTNCCSLHLAYEQLARKAINATPAQSEAWEWNQHVEWIKKFKITDEMLSEGAKMFEATLHSSADFKHHAAHIFSAMCDAIPELKEMK